MPHLNMKQKKPASLYKQEDMISRNPALIIITSFVIVILVGAILLSMPFSSRSGEFTPFINALFTATSATCVTGLATYDTYGYFSLAGQIIILCLIQIGGLGLVTVTSFFYMMLRRKVGLRQAQLAQESISADSRGNTRKLLRMVVLVTFGTELIGAGLMVPILYPQYGKEGIWFAIFHSISAYCNAGFDLFACSLPGASLAGNTENYLLLSILMVLIVSGGLGFIVWQDLLTFKKKKTLQFHTKVVLIATGILIGGGALFYLIAEWTNPATLGEMRVGGKIFHALFQSVTTRTAGFTCFDQQMLHTESKLFGILLMFIGAAPGSTAGGMKITTVLVIFMTIISVIRGDEETTIMGRRIDKGLVYRSLTVCFLGETCLLLCAGVCVKTSDVLLIDALYEAASAIATVGLTANVTAVADVWSKLALIFTMFMGRIGPVAFLMALSNRPKSPAAALRRDPEGKLFVA